MITGPKPSRYASLRTCSLTVTSEVADISITADIWPSLYALASSRCAASRASAFRRASVASEHRVLQASAEQLSATLLASQVASM